MTLWQLVTQSLRFHARSHLGVLLGAILATAIITGALAVGDSVRYSLRRMAEARLGSIDLALFSSGRFFRSALADSVGQELSAPTVPVIILRGAATGYPKEAAAGEGGDTRVGNVRVVGITEGFWKFGGGKTPAMTTADNSEALVINDRLARALSVKVGDEVLLRVDKPSLLSRDAPLSKIEDATVTLRLPISAIVTEAEFGRFSIEANQVPPYNAFLPQSVLQRLIGMEERANGLLVGGGEEKGDSAPNPGSPIPNTSPDSSKATSALWKHWQLADAGLELRDVPGKKDTLELRTNRVFLEGPEGEAALKAAPGAQGVLTYFVNELRVGNRATPYSAVAAVEGSLIPPGMKDDEVLINQWAAEDLGAKVGDRLTLKYWLVGAMRKLEEHTSEFRVRAILPMDGPARDPALMPDIPGLSDKKDCRDWEPGVPIDLEKLRDKDQEYWDRYKGTPKAFIPLRTGQKIWNNRFGNLTAVRYPASGKQGRDTVEMCLRQTLNPASMGLFFQPVRERAFAASAQSLDFGQLFLAFSMFLIVAALLLTALLFAFSVEQRAEEVGILLALGFPPKRVQRLLLLEGAAIALIAGVIGIALATLYTRMVITGLSGVWSGAVAEAALQYHTEPVTLAIGGVVGFLMALFSVAMVTRKQAKSPARELLASGAESESRLLSTGVRARKWDLPVVVLSVIGALGMVGKAMTAEGEMAIGLFFGAGSLLLIAGILACRIWLARQGQSGGMRIGALALRNAARRSGRSLAAITLLACGSFLVVAVGANRHDPNEGAQKRSSGTGGFALYGESSLPVFQDLNSVEGQEAFALDAGEVGKAQILALRLREGDDASCLNLNRAQTPRLFGVVPETLATRRAFTFSQSEDAGSNNPWTLLDRPRDDGAIPVIGDMNTVTWSLGKKLGDTLTITDDRGMTRQLRIVGVLASSIMQGGLILSEENFTRLFPSHSGYQIFLVDAPAEQAQAISRALTRGLEDVGLALTPTADRLAAFNMVENTYLSIFAVLGGLGLLLGSVGLGVIVLRNALERRGELALLRAVGWKSASLHRLLFIEHALLLTLGLLVGIVAALVAVLPALRSPGADIPYGTLAVTLLGIFISGFVWTYLASTLALRAPLMPALRNE